MPHLRLWKPEENSATMELSSSIALAYSPWSLAQRIKRSIDFLGSLVGLCLVAPFAAAIAMAIKLNSPGPVLFAQMRVGRGGRLFKLYKFRTMVADAEQQKSKLLKDNECSGPVFKIKRDPRVTKVGRFLRKYSLDELPQLVNVLKGDMSLVGPRPPLPSEVAQYQPWQCRRLSVPQGLTCIWQVSGRSDVSFEDWVRLDLKYIDSWSIRLDLALIVRTFSVVVKGSGAY